MRSGSLPALLLSAGILTRGCQRTIARQRPDLSDGEAIVPDNFRRSGPPRAQAA